MSLNSHYVLSQLHGNKLIIPEMAFYQDFLSRELNEEDASQTNGKELCLLRFLNKSKYVFVCDLVREVGN